MDVVPVEEDIVVSPLPSPPSQLKALTIGTWNVRGASLRDSQNFIDQVISKHGIHILALQESNSPSKFNMTSNYKWYLSPKKIVSGNRAKSFRNGVGILVTKQPGFSMLRIERISERLLYSTIQTPMGIVRVFSIHIPPNAAESEPVYRDLRNILLKLTYKGMCAVILLGDWNGHIGKDIVDDPMYHGLIGRCLHHWTCDSGGQHLLDFIYQFKLQVCTTFGKHSARITRLFNGSTSQLDHIVTSKESSLFVKAIKGVWVSEKVTDHCLVYATVDQKRSNNDNPFSLSSQSRNLNRSQRTCKGSKKKRWDVSTLSNPKVLDTFSRIISEQRKLKPRILTWPDLVTLLNDTCAKVFTDVKENKDKTLTPRRRNALQSLKKALHDRVNGTVTSSEISAKRRIVQREFDRAREQECCDFFSNLNDFHSIDRIKRTYRFIRNFRRGVNRKTNKQAFIPLSEWYKTLQESEGEDVPLITETDHFPLLPPPTLYQIECIIRRMKRGKAPGVDGIAIELFKAFPIEILQDFVRLLEAVWISNEPPIEWQQTLQFPLPKVPKPTKPSDFRRVTLTPVGYRIYAHFLLDYMDELLEPLGDYQAAFLHNRSVDDHLFTLNRIMEEEWNTGNVLFVLSLDLEKAFDKVNLEVATTVLKGLKLPQHLINRIIKACMWERTSLIWYRQLTPSVRKSMGVKQGCPLSPRLFTILLDAVLQTMSEELNIPLQQQGQGPGFTFPTVLAYADDIVLVSRSIIVLNTMLTTLVPLLESVGLRCNMAKSSIVVRDPCNALGDLGPTPIINIGEFPFKVEKNIKYLGEFHLTIYKVLNLSNLSFVLLQGLHFTLV